MTKLEELIQEYERLIKKTNNSIKQTVKAIDTLGLHPIQKRNSIKTLNLVLNEHQVTKHHYTIFLNQLKEL